MHEEEEEEEEQQQEQEEEKQQQQAEDEAPRTSKEGNRDQTLILIAMRMLLNL